MQRSDVDDVAAALMGADTAGMTAMKLQKLVYYVQAQHLAEYGEPAFDHAIEAWSQGPVVRWLYERHRGARRVSQWAWGESTRLPATVRRIVGLVIDRYGHLSAEELSEMTHRERPWRDARGSLSMRARSAAPIKPDAMRDFYRTQGGRQASAVEDVLASARLEGVPETPERRARLEAMAQGRLTADDAVRQIVGSPGR